MANDMFLLSSGQFLGGYLSDLGEIAIIIPDRGLTLCRINASSRSNVNH